MTDSVTPRDLDGRDVSPRDWESAAKWALLVVLVLTSMAIGYQARQGADAHAALQLRQQLLDAQIEVAICEAQARSLAITTERLTLKAIEARRAVLWADSTLHPRRFVERAEMVEEDGS